MGQAYYIRNQYAKRDLFAQSFNDGCLADRGSIAVAFLQAVQHYLERGIELVVVCVRDAVAAQEAARGTKRALERPHVRKGSGHAWS